MNHKKLKIKLIMPPYDFDPKEAGRLPAPPLGIAQLCHFLRQKGYEAEIDDLDIKIILNKQILARMRFLDTKINTNDVNEYLKTSNSNQYMEEASQILLDLIPYYDRYDIFGFSIIQDINIKYALLLSKAIKQINKRAKIICGGSVSAKLKGLYLNDVIDTVVIGGGEEPLLDFCQRYQKDQKVDNADNLILKKETQFRISMMSSQVTLDHRPDFNGLSLKSYIDIPNDYDFHNFTKNLVIPYVYAYGCPYKCSFCGNSSATQSVKPAMVFEKSVDQIIADLKFLKKKHNTPFLAMYNEYIHTNNHTFKKLCEKIIESNLNLTLTGCIRGNIPLGLVSLMAKAGFLMTSFGLESGSDNVLQKMQKDINTKMINALLKEIDKNGIFVMCFVIINFPGETEKDFKKTFLFLHKNISPIGQVSSDTFRLERCLVRDHPEKFNIKIRSDMTHMGLPKYDEINGRTWEEMELDGKKKQYILQRLLYLYKKIPEHFYRSSMNEILYLSRKHKNHRKVQIELRKIYEHSRYNRPFYLKITNQNNIKNNIYNDKLLPVRSVYNINKIFKILRTENIKNELVIMGGEPTLVKELPDIIREAKRSGWKNIILHTNGRMLAYREYASILINSGVMQAMIPFFGPDSILHDKITGVANSFNQTISGLQNWKDLGGRVELRPIISKHNKKYLYEMLELDFEYSDIRIW